MTLTTMPTHNSSMCMGLAWALGHAQHTAASTHTQTRLTHGGSCPLSSRIAAPAISVTEWEIEQ